MMKLPKISSPRVFKSIYNNHKVEVEYGTKFDLLSANAQWSIVGLMLAIVIAAIVLCASTAKAETFIDFVGNKVIVTTDDEIKIIDVKQEDIESGNVDKIIKDTLEKLNINKNRHR